MRKAFLSFPLILAVAGLVGFGLCGCEEDADDGNIGARLEPGALGPVGTGAESGDTPAVPVEIGSEAATATLEDNGDQVVLTVTGGTPPYTWTVYNALRGTILTDPPTGSSVVYQREAAGDNAVHIVDGDGQTADVVIKQP